MSNDTLRHYIFSELPRQRQEIAFAAGLNQDQAFFDIHWDEYRDKLSLSLETALALSVCINPKHRAARIEWADYWRSMATGRAAKRLADMLTRYVRA